MKLPNINITQNQLSHFDESLKKEWLVTNGIGGYSSSTVLGMNTRKYHGLLVAALNPPSGRTVCCAKMDEEVLADGDVCALGTNEFRDAVFPQGHLLLKGFSISPFPRHVYNAKDVEIRKIVFMPRDKNATIVIYNIVNKNEFEVRFRIYPLLNCRPFHSVVDHWRSPLDFRQQQSEKEVELAFAVPKAAVLIRATSGIFLPKANWIDRLYYREEEGRGESSVDDCYQPGYFEKLIPQKYEEQLAIITVAAESSQELRDDLGTIGSTVNEIEVSMKNALAEKRNMLAKFYSLNKQAQECNWLNWLLLAADTFILKNASVGTSLVAGYHWFEQWGRDAFISMPGLMLTTGRFEDAKKILMVFAKNSSRGLIPNFICETTGKPSYNTVDATLWYVNAVLQYLKYTGDFRFIRDQLWTILKAIIDYHEKGTEFGIHLYNDDLLAHGAQLTWMDAVVDGRAVTPRAGKAVEIQALWYNALRTMKLLADRFGENSLAEKYDSMAEATKESFNMKFWNAERHCLFDVLSDSVCDDSLRPNQLIAISMDFSVLDSDKVERVVDIVQRELLTPFGLRTLSREDPHYRGAYLGDRRSRDLSYHNGTVWPWLFGPFITAFLKAKGYTNDRIEYAQNRFLLPLLTQQIYEAGLGTLSEVFDAEPPHLPRGCVSQAWSVAEPLRAYLEDCLQIRPRYEAILQP